MYVLYDMGRPTRQESPLLTPVHYCMAQEVYVLWELSCSRLHGSSCPLTSPPPPSGAETTIADTVDDRHHLINTVAREGRK